MQRADKLVLAALSFGKKKPDMGIFLDAFVEKMDGLSQNGFVLEHEGQPKLFRTYCICCAVDSVARAPMQGSCSLMPTTAATGVCKRGNILQALPGTQ